MAQHLQLDAGDQAALQALDPSFTFSDGIATVVGEMQIEVARLGEADGTRLQLKIRFPSNEELVVRLLRTQLLQELLEIEADEG